MIRTFLSTAAMIALVSACSPAETADAPADTAAPAKAAEAVLPQRQHT